MWFVLFQVQYWVKPVSGFGIVFTLVGTGLYIQEDAVVES